ncbi:uncharacterized protein LOC143117474 [Alosa pseudoharengus]|uniref:uncharacterized protein LOC143117474 n=1 Tax=Alosa pseudoharengus TaxID=34774 RepID=UPI003F8BCC9B
MYSIVEFLGEKTVGIVASNWIRKEGDKTYSYWPLNNPTQRAKERVLHDPKTWLKRPVRIFSSSDDWDQAVRRNKRAETKSCVETGKEDKGKRIIVKPKKFTHNVEKKTQKKKEKKQVQHSKTSLPPAPQTGLSTPRPSSSYLSPQPSPQHPPQQYASRPATDDDDSLPSSPARHYTDNDDDSIPSSIEPPSPIYTGDGDRRETMPIWAKNINATLEVLLRKVETMEQNQREALRLLQAKQHGDPGEATVELEQAQTQAELNKLEEHLKNRDFTKKMISHLSLVGGSNPGECVRRVLRSVASNYVWSSYSLRGKKGKMPLLGTAVGSTIKQAIMKWKPGLGEKDVELLIAEVLKHAPAAHSKSLKGRMERQVEDHPQN